MEVSLLAQVRVIKGTVKDLYKGPIYGVTVGNSDEWSVLTDNNGDYKITIPDSIQELIFSKIGYYITTEKINNRTEIDVLLKGLDLMELSLKDLLQVNVSTVSLSEQKIIEAPGVVSILTHEELHLMGIRTIREALTLVAGFTPLQNDDEQILAVRGIYATTDQKILVMRDGHSLNEANIDLPQTDYSLSIENIKKIEIIRGPGASIYGNSAVAAVVNIITTDQEGSRVKLGVGNYGQFNLEAVSCIKTRGNGKFMAFGRYTGTNGQPFDVKVQKGSEENLNGTYLANHYPSNYDIGFNYSYRQFSTILSIRHHSYKTYWSAQGFYTNVDSLLVKPGLKQDIIHYGFSVDPKIKDKVKLHLQHYVDYCKLSNTRLLSSIDDSMYINGRVQLSEWNVLKGGLNYYSIWQYSLSGQMVGGVSLEQRRYLDTWLASNTKNPSTIEYSQRPFFAKGKELRAACFFQVQQSLTDWLKVDCGARYDWAENFDASFNPRIALIANIYEPLTFKAIFTKAFQAPGYSYRTSNADFSGSIDALKPERLTTYQVSLRYDFLKMSYVEISAYYNRLKNLITRSPDKNYYANIGQYASYGIEADAHYTIGDISSFFNYSLLLPDTVFFDSNYLITNIHKNDFKNFPKHSVNAGFIYNLTESCHFAAYAQYASGFYASDNSRMDQRIVFNTSLTIQELIKDVEFQLSVYNLANKKYKLGDPSFVPIEQPGRWFMFSVLYTFKEK
jgi:iron complex outermembrane receptor protein